MSKQFVKTLLNVFGLEMLYQQIRLTNNHYMNDLNRLDIEINKLIKEMQPTKSKRILMGPSFSIYDPCYIHDRILSYVLRLRGVDIIPIFCDAIQSVECNVYGGVWKSGEFKDRCRNCIHRSTSLWASNPLPAIGLSKYINELDIIGVENRINLLANEEWATYIEDGMPFGLWSKDILVNNYVVGDFKLVKNYNSLGKSHLKNLLILRIAYERAIDDIKPQIVISNDSYYGMWAILQKLSKNAGIPFYSHWTGVRQGAWCYALDDASMNLNFSESWKRFSQIPLNIKQEEKIDKWMEKRFEGKEMILNTAKLGESQDESFDLDQIDLAKPTALLAANVIWDLAALNKQVVFNDMIDWITSTITWFASHPSYQIIIKPHPAEQNPAIPETVEQVSVALADRGVLIPDNVFLLSPKVNLSVYDLFEISKVGLVHTSTVGYELAARGKPVITTAISPYRGFGFTLDAKDKDDYFSTMEATLKGESLLEQKKQIDLARKFILFYNYHYCTKINIMDYRWGQVPTLKVKTALDLLPGNNKYIDYIVDSMLNGYPILSQDRWPPES